MWIKLRIQNRQFQREFRLQNFNKLVPIQIEHTSRKFVKRYQEIETLKLLRFFFVKEPLLK